MVRWMALGAATALLAGCAPVSAKREIGLVESLPAAQCPAEAAVAWDAYDYYDFEDIEASFAERAEGWGWPATAGDLTGDDVNVRFHIGANIHVNRTNRLRAFRRDGVWTVETSSSAGAGSFPHPPPPPDFEGGDHPSLRCYAENVILRGGISERLEAAVDAFLADGCRSQIPILSPAPLFLRDADGIGCEDGAAAYLQIETADGVERYIQRCAIPGSTLAALIAALEGARAPVDAEGAGIGQFALLTVDELYEGGNTWRACRAKAEEMFPDTDFTDPWEW